MTGEEITASGVLWRALSRRRRRILTGVTLLCVHQTAEALVPVAIGVVVDRAVGTGSIPALLISLAALALLFTVLAFAYRFGARNAYSALEHEAHTTRVEIAGRALDPRGLRGGPRDGELLSIAASDAELSAFVVRAAGASAAAVTALLVSATALLVLDVPLGLGVLVGVPLVVLLLQRLAPLLTRRGEVQQEALATSTALAVDLLSGLRVLRGIGAQDHAARRYAAASRHALAVTLRSANTKGLHLGLTTTVNGLFLAVVAGFAGWQALAGRLTVGELIAVVGLAQFIAEPVQTLGWCVQLFATARASAGRIAGVLSAAPLAAGGAAGLPAPAEARLSLDDVGYATLDGVSLRVSAGEIVGLLAYDPQDADALVRLLAGRVPRADYRGVIHVDGVAADTLRLDDCRAALLVEPHHVALFEGTLRTNLLTAAAAPRGAGRLDVSAVPDAFAGPNVGAGPDAFAGPDAGTGPDTIAGPDVAAGPGALAGLNAGGLDAFAGLGAGAGLGGGGGSGGVGAGGDEFLHAALRSAGALDVLEAHPDGLDRQLTERGANLSGGQRQRIGLARALAADPPVLVLHDPTTSVDAVTEGLVADGLAVRRGVAPRGTLLITSSPALLRAAHRVAVLDGGRVVAEGTHDQLAATQPRYREAVLR